MDTGEVRLRERTLYEVLNVARDATQEEISEACLQLWSAYRSKSRSPILKEVLARIDEAHTTLTDTRARAAYDALLASGRIHLAQRRGSRLTIANEVRMQRAARPTDQAPQAASRSRFALAISLSGAFAALIFSWIVLVFGPEDVSDGIFLASIFAFLGCAVTFLALMILRWAMKEEQGPMTPLTAQTSWPR